MISVKLGWTRSRRKHIEGGTYQPTTGRTKKKIIDEPWLSIYFVPYCHSRQRTHPSSGWHGPKAPQSKGQLSSRRNGGVSKQFLFLPLSKTEKVCVALSSIPQPAILHLSAIIINTDLQKNEKNVIEGNWISFPKKKRVRIVEWLTWRNHSWGEWRPTQKKGLKRAPVWRGGETHISRNNQKWKE